MGSIDILVLKEKFKKFKETIPRVEFMEFRVDVIMGEGGEMG